MEKTLSHYTQFPVLISILESGKIVLGNPDNWEDKTDRNIVTKYAEFKGKIIRALCLTEFSKNTQDSILHWKIYAPSKSGCRIDINKVMLIKIAKSQGAKIKKVEYIEDPDYEKLAPQKIPFIKRNSYSSENEWRIIRIGEKNDNFELDISNYLKKGIIQRIKLSPELPESLSKCLCDFLWKKYKIPVTQSWIFKNPVFERKIKKSLPSRKS